MAMGDGNGDGNSNGNKDGNSNGVGDGDRDGNGNCNDNGHGKGNHYKRRVASSCAGDVQPPPWTQRKVHSPALHHGDDTAKSVCSPSRGRVPDSSPWIVFCLFFTTTVQFTEQPSDRPPHYSGTEKPFPPINALPPPLLQEPCQPIDNIPRLLLHFLSR